MFKKKCTNEKDLKLKNKRLGLKDMPIMGNREESLGLSDYSSALSEFIMSCETPITISIQGDWGSGKTSIMNLIKENIERQSDKKNRIKTIWFNTWQYSQFNLEEYLAISLISFFVKEITGQKNEKVKKILNAVTMLGKAAVVGTASMAGASDAVKDSFSCLESENRIDGAMKVKELKDTLEETVSQIIGNNSEQFERIVVFIDDLDRLVPEKAVDFLEVFKIFLDIENCVFVLACDYNVVMQGLQQKFGVGEKELKGKSFFDKIIQLPFSMPMGLGDRQGYIGDLLDKIEANYEYEDLDHYEELIEKSVGFNPRNMKRIFNSLLLLNLVAKKKKLILTDYNEDIATEAEKQKILFAILCMQIAYEPVYRYCIRNKEKINQDFFDSFINYNELIKNIDVINMNHPYLLEIQKELNDDNENSKMKKLSIFMKQFYNCIHLAAVDDRENLLPEEQDMLKSILSFSSITSIEPQDVKDEEVTEKNVKYHDFFSAYLIEFDTALEKLNMDDKIIDLNRDVKQKYQFVFTAPQNRSYSFGFHRKQKCSISVSLFDNNKLSNKKQLYDKLRNKKDAIEKEFGEELTWVRTANKRTSKISFFRENCTIDDDNLEEIRRWGVNLSIKLYQAIEKNI